MLWNTTARLTATATFALRRLKSHWLNECAAFIKAFWEVRLLGKINGLTKHCRLSHSCSFDICVFPRTPVTLRSNRSRESIMNFAFKSGVGPSLFSRLSLRRLASTQETRLTWVNISCSCRSMSLLADPSDLCSSMREKCSMLLMDSFSCRVKITSLNTDRRWGREARYR